PRSCVHSLSRWARSLEIRSSAARARPCSPACARASSSQSTTLSSPVTALARRGEAVTAPSRLPQTANCASIQGMTAPSSMSSSAPSLAELRQRLEEIGRQVGREEALHRADALRTVVAEALQGFHAAAAASGAPHLRIELGPTRLDDKHVRAVEFEIRRGRHLGIVTVKSRGEITLVGPFHAGKKEGPCMTFPFAAERELLEGLG